MEEARNSVAISISFLSVCSKPVIVFIYRVGRTTTAGIMTDKSSESAHNRTSITNEATGTDFSTFMGNHKKALMNEQK